MHTLWDDVGGDGRAGTNLFENAKSVLRQPAYVDGVYVDHASWDAVAGDGRLFYNDSTSMLSWAEYGDSAGLPVDITAPQELYPNTFPGDGWFRLLSGNGHYITVVVLDSDDLTVTLATDTTWVIKPTKFRKTDIIIYAGPNGDWTGFSDAGETPTDIEAPTVPTDVLATADSTTSIDVDWTASTDNVAVAGYDVYGRDITNAGARVFLTTVSFPTVTYRHAGLTEGDFYEYDVSAFDAAGNYSVASQTTSSSTSISSSYVNDDTEFTAADIAGWTVNNCSVSEVESGIVRITNTGGSNAYIWHAWTTAAGKTAIDYDVRYRKGDANGYLAIDATKPTYSGGNVDNSLNSSTGQFVIESGSGTVIAETEYFIMIWVNSSTIGTYFDVDYIRVTEP
jgi:hypothetical protein